MSVSDANHAQSLMNRAEAAAAAGDWRSAARTLRDLAALQEVELGAANPQLANTLNNLAVVSERAGELDAADAAFRRALTITRTAFDEEHPSVATSLRNLQEFCEAHGRPFEQVATSLPNPPEAREAAAVQSVGGRSWATIVAVGGIAGAIAAMLLIWTGRGRVENTTAAVPQTPPAVPAKPEPLSPPAPIAPSPPVPARQPTASAMTVVSAEVCRDFSSAGGGEWRCTPVGATAPAGPFVFLTRIKAAQSTTVEHRWYRGDVAYQRVSLRIAANPGAGFRTFSRNTVSANRAGEWRVELRDASGLVVEERRFVVTP